MQDILLKLIHKQTTSTHLLHTTPLFTTANITDYLNTILTQSCTYNLYMHNIPFLNSCSYMMNELGLTPEDTFEITYEEIKPTQANFEVLMPVRSICGRDSSLCVCSESVYFMNGARANVKVKDVFVGGNVCIGVSDCNEFYEIKLGDDVFDGSKQMFGCVDVPNYVFGGNYDDESCTDESYTDESCTVDNDEQDCCDANKVDDNIHNNIECYEASKIKDSIFKNTTVEDSKSYENQDATNNITTESKTADTNINYENRDNTTFNGTNESNTTNDFATYKVNHINRDNTAEVSATNEINNISENNTTSDIFISKVNYTNEVNIIEVSATSKIENTDKIDIVIEDNNDIIIEKDDFIEVETINEYKKEEDNKDDINFADNKDKNGKIINIKENSNKEENNKEENNKEENNKEENNKKENNKKENNNEENIKEENNKEENNKKKNNNGEIGKDNKEENNNDKIINNVINNGDNDKIINNKDIHGDINNYTDNKNDINNIINDDSENYNMVIDNVDSINFTDYKDINNGDNNEDDINCIVNNTTENISYFNDTIKTTNKENNEMEDLKDECIDNKNFEYNYIDELENVIHTKSIEDIKDINLLEHIYLSKSNEPVRSMVILYPYLYYVTGEGDFFEFNLESKIETCIIDNAKEVTQLIAHDNIIYGSSLFYTFFSYNPLTKDYMQHMADFPCTSFTFYNKEILLGGTNGFIKIINEDKTIDQLEFFDTYLDFMCSSSDGKYYSYVVKDSVYVMKGNLLKKKIYIGESIKGIGWYGNVIYVGINDRIKGFIIPDTIEEIIHIKNPEIIDTIEECIDEDIIEDFGFLIPDIEYDSEEFYN
ncbi:hypothetical protein COBT_002223 [Conglomerata obtusa]